MTGPALAAPPPAPADDLVSPRAAAVSVSPAAQRRQLAEILLSREPVADKARRIEALFGVTPTARECSERLSALYVDPGDFAG